MLSKVDNSVKAVPFHESIWVVLAHPIVLFPLRNANSLTRKWERVWVIVR